VNISFSSCKAVLTEGLAVSRITAKFVPLLSDDQKSRCLKVCEELKQRVEMEPHFISLTQNQNEVKREKI
jgi:hypothetical protein